MFNYVCQGEFEVPETQTFNEYFASELEKFVEKVEDLSGVEIMFLVEEPTFPGYFIFITLLLIIFSYYKKHWFVVF